MRCKTCKKEKPENEYDRTSRGNRIVICRECRSSSERKIKKLLQRKAYKFGWTLEQLRAVLDKQRNRCESCSRKFDYRRLNEVVVDYNPTTMELYGFLCVACKDFVSVIRRRRFEPELVHHALSYCNRTVYVEENLFEGQRKFT